MARYGIHLYLGADVEKVSLTKFPVDPFNPSYDDDLPGELAEGEPDLVWVTKRGLWPEVRARLAGLGYRAEALGASFEERVIFRVLLQASRLPPKAGAPASDTRKAARSSPSTPPRATRA
jgi:hypothetical protein